MHACRGASDGRQERDAVIVSVMVAVCVQFPISGFVEWGVRSLRCVRVRESAVKVGVSCATAPRAEQTNFFYHRLGCSDPRPAHALPTPAATRELLNYSYVLYCTRPAADISGILTFNSFSNRVQFWDLINK